MKKKNLIRIINEHYETVCIQRRQISGLRLELSKYVSGYATEQEILARINKQIAMRQQAQFDLSAAQKRIAELESELNK